jgi:hypothetical protein
MNFWVLFEKQVTIVGIKTDEYFILQTLLQHSLVSCL